MTDRRTLEHGGCRLSYSVRGEGPPVLLVRGVGIHGGGWRPRVDALASRCRCLAYDNRGVAIDDAPRINPLLAEHFATADGA